MKYITFIPLIGGMAVANAKAVGHKPEFVLSYGAFAKNESNLKAYWPDVEWHLLDADTSISVVLFFQLSTTRNEEKRKTY